MTLRSLSSIRVAGGPSPAVLAFVSGIDAEDWTTLASAGCPGELMPDGSIIAEPAVDSGFFWRWRQDPTPSFAAGGWIVGMPAGAGNSLTSPLAWDAVWWLPAAGR
jgi:hypothetical protein